MALDIDIQFTGIDGNNIEGSCMQVGREGTSLGNAFEHTVSSPRDAATGKATGKRQHGAVKIWKEIDKASPILAEALYNNSRLQSAVIRFWQSSPDGTENNYFTCSMQGVRIVSHTIRQLHNRFDNGKDMAVEAFDVFELVYETIEYTYTDGNISANDSWLRGRRR